MMQEKRKSAYQEGIVGLLLGDVNDPGTCKGCHSIWDAFQCEM